jgi:Rrf2 family protein
MSSSSLLTATACYAATALGYLAERHGVPARIPDIAKARGIPRPYLAKIVRKLSAKGIVATRRGVGGGVVLAVDPASLSLLDLCRALDEPALVTRCVLGRACCDDELACPLHEAIQKIRALQAKLLASTPLSEIGRRDAEQRAAQKDLRKRGA